MFCQIEIKTLSGWRGEVGVATSPTPFTMLCQTNILLSTIKKTRYVKFNILHDI